jgi:beta-lactamase superfamily II metal-dependent hydrolase
MPILFRRVRGTMLAMRATPAAIVTGILLLSGAAVLQAARNLEIYFVDVEGGQATLMRTPDGQSLLIDTGWPDFNHRDPDRIAAAAKRLGIKRIDYLIVTHFHQDHVGGVQGLARKMPIVNFVDHGQQTETGKDAEVLFNEYSAFRAKGHHIVAKPGDTIPVKGIDVQVLSAAGNVIGPALPGAGQPNPACSGPRPDADNTENGQSSGVLITYGSFRMLDLGDLTKDREFDLMCPGNKIGTVDLFVVSHHGTPSSDSAALVRGIEPRVAVVDNGAKKGGSAEVWQTIRDTRSVLDIWQLHYAVDADKQHNSPDTFIANIDQICQGDSLRAVAEKDGTFTLFNSRNQFQKKYVKK